MLKLIGNLFIKLIGGTRNDRIIRGRLRYVRENTNPLEEKMRSLSDDELRRQKENLRQRLEGGEDRQSIRPEVFATVREACRRAQNHRHFDVQIVAGMILDNGWIAEEATGEGKTIACYPAIYMAALEGKHTHLVTTNDYLVKVGADFAAPVFEMLGMTVGYITTGMTRQERRAGYACDVTYGSNSEFGFDYLRDNLVMSADEQVQGPLDFAIVDEVDNILIDEARTPLIISGPSQGQTDRYRKADQIARDLIRRNRPWDSANQRVESLKQTLTALQGEQSKVKGDQARAMEEKIRKAQQEQVAAEAQLDRHTKLYEVELDKKSVHMTDEGVLEAQELAGVGSFYVGSNMEWPHLMQQSLEAHLVRERDKDYVVQDGAVVIVDEFTGRLLEGRQWAHGLHQAVEAKENVTIKEETQTIGTITYQNYFKLYSKLAGMTGTAITEAEEFQKIFGIDTAVVPTHRPINRIDHNDRIYAETDGKYDAIVEEVNTYSKMGRPVLVGTTSIEKSEKISELLTRRYGIDHQLLNGRKENATRESEIVLAAGRQHPLKGGGKQMVGTVTIATNMAGRGTDIKLGPGVVYDKCKVPPAARLAELGVEVEDIFPPGSNKCCIHCPQYDASSDCSHCFKPKVDADFPNRGRTACRDVTPCGLHIVGTERHEARRIDNQLRGRAGRQGDPGSSRFFLSLRDDLIAVFAGPWMMKVLGWLGLQGDMAIEDKRVSKGIERAQRKVEQRNFDMRKNLLEYDEVMDYQRRTFYGRRQAILEGRDLEGQVGQMIRESVHEVVEDYLDGRYPHRCIAEWARQNLQMSVRDDQIRSAHRDVMGDLAEDLRKRAKDEAVAVINITLGEYMGDDIEQSQWDLRGLSGWAMSRFGVTLSQNQLRRMTAEEVAEALTTAAAAKIDKLDLAPLGAFLAEDFPAQSLAEWARNKFDIDVGAAELDGSAESAAETLIEMVEAAYNRRAVEYPIEYALEMTIGSAGADNVYAARSLADWVNHKYQANWSVDDIRDARSEDIRDRILTEAQSCIDGDRLGQMVRSQLGGDPDVESAIQFARTRFDTELAESDFDGDIAGKLRDVGGNFLRREMTELERFVLLQIHDSVWMDHLLAMDHLKAGIGMRSFAEQDPRVLYKREGAQLFQEMLASAREEVTEMIFKVRLAAGEEISSVYQVSSMVHEQLTAYDQLAQEMAAQQQAAASDRRVRVETIRRDVEKVGRNDPCPCGSGKKYKKCCGRIQ